MRQLSDTEIIEIRKFVQVRDYRTPYADTLAFAKAILEAAQKETETKGE